ncbi:beta-1,6-N-acetylglucosaminyltransferase [Scheffersomyces coipomensis]|uniref:beta-1,6-N-acetylglucosaminyltransferase n=1 Tax=Scheffersomyces coipomensis TaxID=1788519 RepID=UPI00315D22BA
MKFTQSVFISILAALTSTVSAGCTLDGGNYYCSQTNKITYPGLGYSGSYQDVTDMNEQTGVCTQQSLAFSGNLSPLDEELSIHFRGPIKLLQFGVYLPAGTSNTKRDEQAVADIADEDCETRHVHHQHKRATEILEVTETVYVNINGQTVESSTTVATSVAAPPPIVNSVPPQEPVTSTPTTAAAPPTTLTTSSTSSTTSTSSTSNTSSPQSSAAAGDWEQVAYYSPGSANNLVFMNYYGGSGSGVWSSSFGNSLSYANADASGGSSTPVALGSNLVPSNNEYVIFSGQQCSGDDCGYYRSGIPAYHGFGGDQKIFVFEFEMPTDTGASGGLNFDMPAVWLLNAKIPRTLQYGAATCSCWLTGCGELDLFEILDSGDNRLISHLHDGQGSNGSAQGGGGSQDYFSRPTSGSLAAAVIFQGNSVSILEVANSFDAVLSSETVQGWINQSGSVATIQ